MNQTTLISAFVVMLGICVAASITDVRTHRIPNKLTGLAILAGLGFWLVAGLVSGRGLLGSDGTMAGTFGASFIGLLCGLVPFAVLVMMGGLGGGDMKLMGAIGAWSASGYVVLGVTIYALVIAMGMAIVLMVRHGRVKITLYRLVGIAASGGKAIRPDEDKTAPKVPFAVAAAGGAAIAGAELMLGWWDPLLL